MDSKITVEKLFLRFIVELNWTVEGHITRHAYISEGAAQRIHTILTGFFYGAVEDLREILPGLLGFQAFI